VFEKNLIAIEIIVHFHLVHVPMFSLLGHWLSRRFDPFNSWTTTVCREKAEKTGSPTKVQHQAFIIF